MFQGDTQQVVITLHQDIFSLDATQHEAKLVVLGMLQHYFLILERSESYVHMNYVHISHCLSVMGKWNT